MLRILDLAFEHPAMTVTFVAEKLGVSYPAAANNLKPLLESGVAKELVGSYPKLIIFPSVMDTMRIG